jgi:hypothetical protein
MNPHRLAFSARNMLLLISLVYLAGLAAGCSPVASGPADGLRHWTEIIGYDHGLDFRVFLDSGGGARVDVVNIGWTGGKCYTVFMPCNPTEVIRLTRAINALAKCQVTMSEGGRASWDTGARWDIRCGIGEEAAPSIVLASCWR